MNDDDDDDDDDDDESKFLWKKFDCNFEMRRTVMEIPLLLLLFDIWIGWDVDESHRGVY